MNCRCTLRIIQFNKGFSQFFSPSDGKDFKMSAIREQTYSDERAIIRGLIVIGLSHPGAEGLTLVQTFKMVPLPPGVFWIRISFSISKNLWIHIIFLHFKSRNLLYNHAPKRDITRGFSFSSGQKMNKICHMCCYSSNCSNGNCNNIGYHKANCQLYKLRKSHCSQFASYFHMAYDSQSQWWYKIAMVRKKYEKCEKKRAHFQFENDTNNCHSVSCDFNFIRTNRYFFLFYAQTFRTLSLQVFIFQ